MSSPNKKLSLAEVASEQLASNATERPDMQPSAMIFFLFIKISPILFSSGISFDTMSQFFLLNLDLERGVLKENLRFLLKNGNFSGTKSSVRNKCLQKKSHLKKRFENAKFSK